MSVEKNNKKLIFIIKIIKSCCKTENNSVGLIFLLEYGISVFYLSICFFCCMIESFVIKTVYIYWENIDTSDVSVLCLPFIKTLFSVGVQT